MKKTDVAIVGISCTFPGAPDKETFWKNILNKVDSTQVVPEDRIDPVHFSSGHSIADRFYCNRGGFIPDVKFDPTLFGILPLAVEGTEPDHLITLKLAYDALQDAHVFKNNLSLDQTGIIIGKGNYTGPGATRAIEIVRTSEQIVQVLQEALPNLSADELDQVKKEYQKLKGRFEPDTAMGLIPNLVASLVANRLNLGGTAYTLDAACASALIAVDHAIAELESGRCNMVIAGGVHIGQNAAFWSIFNQLGALSKKGKIKPFDEHADGLIIGEGCGFVVLKRLEDAIACNDRIYAVLKGVGVSSDGSGTSVMSPSTKGQVKAIEQAWVKSGLEKSHIGYIEGHGTGTPLGDKTELESLKQFFGLAGDQPKAGLGSVKSNIGHAMPAAGMAGLIKTALALYHDIIPPSLHCSEPLVQMQHSRFQLVQDVTRWADSGRSRIAGVNAFGFGGINAHAVLQGYTQWKENTPNPIQEVDQVLLLARHTHEELLAALQEQDQSPGFGPFRVAVFNPDQERIDKAIKIVSRNKPWKNRQDIWYSNEPMLSNGGKIAFLFPGLDGLEGGEVESIANHFGIVQKNNQKADGLLNEAINLLHKSNIIDQALKRSGVFPEMNAGHSLGEWLAARSSELAEESSVLELLQQLDPKTFELKDSRFIAVGCGIGQLEDLIKDIDQLYLSNDNCPQQVILCGTYAALEKLVPMLKARQIFHQILPFQSGFHSPFVEDKIDDLLNGMSNMQFQKTKFPLWSATTLDIYPEGLEAIRALSIEHLIKPVRFRELTERLFENGARVFIQMGSGGLIGFIDDTLKGKEYSSVSSSVPLRSGIKQLQRVFAALFVEGKEAGMELMGYGEKPNFPGKGIKLELGSALVKSLPTLKTFTAKQKAQAAFQPALLEDVPHSLVHAFNSNMAEMMEVQSEMIHLFEDHLKHGRPFIAPQIQSERIRQPFSKTLNISLENCPYLIDHSLLKQPKNWHCVDDMDPVIPMTMIFELFAETAAAHSNGEWPQKILNIKVFQWMNVSRPFRETITGEWKGAQLVYLNLEKFANAEVLLSNHYNLVPQHHFDIGKKLDIARSSAEIYDQHMFHGPGYQGIKQLVVVGEKGIVGLIHGGAGKGSLLDNAGQLFGLWLQLTLTKDRIAFPVKIQEIEFFSDMTDQEGIFECTCVLTEINDEFATGNFIIKRDEQVWAMITGWQNRRLEIDDALWNVSMSPLRNRLSEEIAPGIFLFHHAYNRVVSWDFVLKRYFNQEEKKHHQSLMPNKRKEWMISRVAVKDAVRNLLNHQKNESYFPIAFQVNSDELRRPYLVGPMIENIHISIAHKGTDAVGIAQYNRPVGIDMESIEPRSLGFYEMVFSATEQELLAGKDQDEWATRFWVAKEAYGKYLGKGLQGNPKAYTISGINGEELLINDVIIKTIKHKNYIIGWTL